MQANEDERMIDRRAASRMGAGGAEADAGEAAAGSNAGNGGERVAGAAPATESAQLAEALANAETYQRNWQRAAADYQNFKRRVEQERSESARFASAALVINLLPVYDDLDRAASTIDASLAGLNWVQGVLAIQRKFQQLLQAMGVSEVPTSGVRFDPAQHEAVAQQPGAEGAILHVVQKGYKLGEKVIRPAMVIVGDGMRDEG